MTGGDSLCDGVRILLPAAAGFLPAAGLGVVRQDGPGHVLLTYVDAFGATAYRAPELDLPEAFRPGSTGLVRVPAADLESNPLGLVESRVLHTGFTDDIRGRYGVRQVITLPVPVADTSTRLVLGLANGDPLTSTQLPQIDELAARVVDYLRPAESSIGELELLRRLDFIERCLPALFRVLDVREIFDRLSSIAKQILRHDFASLGILSDDLNNMELYVQTSEGPSWPRGGPMPFPRVQTAAWLYRFVDDLTAHPLEAGFDTVKAGGRTSLRVAIRFDETILGALNVTSRDPAPYTATDLAIARRIADYVGLALSHHRLAEDSRRAAALRERQANLQMLDGLLSTLTGVLDIRDVFDRVSEISRQVLSHDALAIAEVIDGGARARVHACEGLGPLKVPFDIPTAGRRFVVEPWEFRLIDDMHLVPEYATTPGAMAGMHSMLIVPIRVEGRYYGGLIFCARAIGRFTRDDVLVANRIADHVALALSHQRLAEQARLHEELRARAEKSDLLDELLASVTSSGRLPEVFDRVSDITQKVLAHDAIFLAVREPGGRQARIYASKTSGTVHAPEVLDVPPSLLANSNWEYDLVDDLQAHADQAQLWATQAGFRAALSMPIRLDNEFVGGLSFMSFTPGKYVAADVPVARRITDRVALSFARERGEALLKRADEATARASKLESRVKALTEELDARTGYRRVVGESPQWRQVLKQATQVAATETTVLLLGESGTGKEVVARFVHRASARNGGPFIALNCAALPEQLLEAELFGYERGAYTGAVQSKPGQLEQAAGGTLFLDEVGEMSPSAQAKFLRVLQEREFQRLGGTRVLRTDARIVAATNRDLQRAIGQGQFREDLYYRLHVFAIQLPPLRDRRDDILPLSEAFMLEIGRGIGRPPAGISHDARKRLIEYHWPGNVRELRNILERATILCEGGLIAAEHLSLNVTVQTAAATEVAAAAAIGPPVSAGDLSSMERAMIEDALEAARFNKSKAARTLGLTRQQLYVRMKRYGLE